MTRFIRYIQLIKNLSLEAFYLYSAIQSRQKILDSALPAQLKQNPHPLEKYRCNCPLSRLKLFRELYQVKASIDEFGNFYANQITETKYKSSPLIDYYADWTVDTSGTQGDFTQNGDTAENAIISAPDPFGKEGVKIWQCTPEAVSGADGGWNHDFTCDDTKRYLFSVFIKSDAIFKCLISFFFY